MTYCKKKRRFEIGDALVVFEVVGGRITLCTNTYQKVFEIVDALVAFEVIEGRITLCPNTNLKVDPTSYCNKKKV